MRCPGWLQQQLSNWTDCRGTLNLSFNKSPKSDFGKRKKKTNKQGIVVFSECKSNSSSQCICVGLFSAFGLGVLARGAFAAAGESECGSGKTAQRETDLFFT